MLLDKKNALQCDLIETFALVTNQNIFVQRRKQIPAVARHLLFEIYFIM